MQFCGGEDALFHCSEQDIAANLPRRNVGLGHGGQCIKRVDIGFWARALGMRWGVSTSVIDTVAAESADFLNIARKPGG